MRGFSGSRERRLLWKEIAGVKPHGRAGLRGLAFGKHDRAQPGIRIAKDHEDALGRALTVQVSKEAEESRRS
jgi:hypothetical protein